MSAWTELPDGSWESGSFIVCKAKGSWWIYSVDADGVRTRAMPKSRLWGYGSAGQAKVGAALMEKKKP